MSTVQPAPAKSVGDRILNQMLHGLFDAIGTAIFLSIGFGSVMLANAEALPLPLAAALVGTGFGVGLKLGIIATGPRGSGFLNWAVTFMALLFRGDNRLPLSYLPALVIGQTLGAVVAVAVVLQFTPPAVLQATAYAAPSPGKGYGVGAMWGAELLGSFVFFLVINTVINAGLPKDRAASLISETLGVVVALFYAVDGGSFNPLRGLIAMFIASRNGFDFPLGAWAAVIFAPFIAAVAVFVVQWLGSQIKDPSEV